ncbi:MAG: hypothetical protein JNJ65_17980 [Cyclobacteriaceae bacterium]|jgi:hypothetical protein|nr:hypothetical protein [Cyclobacteriaceae bacterium]
MTRAFLPGIMLIITLSACTQRLICPAYQSSFIYDKPTQREKFVYYNESTTQPRDVLASNSKTITLPPRDSSWVNSDVLKGPALPQVRRVKKDRYLLLPEKTYKQALKALRTVEMKPVYPKKADSLDLKSELDSAARSVSDTVSAQGAASQPVEDSVYVITKTKEKYNLDQDAYMWYFRDVLVLPDVRAAMMEEGKVQAAKKKSEAKGGFFKNLFKKKDKNDSTKVATPEAPSDSTTTNTKKKGLKGLFKKKSKVDTATQQKKTDPVKKEDEDDGF